MIWLLLFVLQAEPDEVEGRAIPAQQVSWVQAGVSPSQAQAMTYRLYVVEESGVQTTVALGSTLCGAASSVADSQCSTALPPAGVPAIVTGNTSRLTATEAATQVESPLSTPFTGDQGCVFAVPGSVNLFAVGQRTGVVTGANQEAALRRRFQAAKFRWLSTTVLDGGQVRVREECVGYLVTE